MSDTIQKWAGQIPSSSLEYAMQRASEELGRNLAIAERDQLEAADAADKAGRMAKLVVEGVGWEEAIQLYGVYSRKFPSLPSGKEIAEICTPSQYQARESVGFLYAATIKIAKVLLRRAYEQWPGWFGLKPDGFSAIPHTWGRGDRTFTYDALKKRVVVDYVSRPTNLHAYDLMRWVEENSSAFEITWGDGSVESYGDTEEAALSPRISSKLKFVLEEIWKKKAEETHARLLKSRIE